MDPFELPEELPTDPKSLAELKSGAHEVFQSLVEIVESGGDLTPEQLEELKGIVAAIDKIEAAEDAANAADEARKSEITDLIAKVKGGDTEADPEADSEDEGDPVAEAEKVAAEAASAEAEKVAAAAAAEAVITASAGKRGVVAKTKFSGLGSGKTPKLPVKRSDGGTAVEGWRMDPNTFGYKAGHVGFSDIAEVLDAVRPGSRARSNRGTVSGQVAYSANTIARLDRDLPEVSDPHALVAAIEAATKTENLVRPQFGEDGALTAAGGWCAPSEQLYDFCDVPTATDLVSLPEITINRGGVKWPVEPDLTEIFESFQFFFTETQLEATDGEGNPTAIKNCVEVPCPDEFEELRLNAVGYCVNASILQDQGWPELIEWFLRSLTAEHLRAISRRTILDMVAGSGAVKIIPALSQIATGSAFLNSLALMAVNLRLQRGLGRAARIEFVAPNWVPEAIRADLANQQGVETKSITDQQIEGWLNARNLAGQWVADWQTRSDGFPGDLGATPLLSWPTTVDVIMYPAGTWFRAMSNVIELGVMYPKEQLQVNRYTRFFTEDAIAVGKRCDQSILVRVPICASGAYGAQEAISCSENQPSANEVQSLTAQGTVSGGTFTLTYDGQTTTAIAWNASAATIKAALDALSNLAPADTSLTGGALPGTPVVVTFQGALAGANVSQLAVDNALITGGGSIQAATTTQGQS